MSVVGRAAGRRRFRFRTDLRIEACRQRLAANPDSSFTTLAVADDEFTLKKTIPAAVRHLRRQTPPVVRARLTSAANGTCVAVEGRMNYAALASAPLMALFMVAGPVFIFIVPTVRDGRPLNSLGPVFVFVLAMPTLIYGSVWVGATRQSTDLAHRLALVLEAHPEAAPL